MAAKNTDRTTVKLAAIGSMGTGLVLLLLPFHALFTTWLGSNFHHLDAFRIWKELTTLSLAALAIAVLVRRRRFWSFVTGDGLVLLILSYALWQILMAVIAVDRHQVNGPAVIYGLLSNLRFVGFLVIAMVFARYHQWLRRHWPKLVLGPALVVIAFGLLQLVLPQDFLRHFGYGPATIPAFHLVDEKSAYIRLQSTLRGPNPLGAYLVLVLSLAAAAWWRFKRQRLNLGLLFAAGLIVLYFTYSRSAILGLAVSLVVIAVTVLPTAKLRVGAASLLVIMALLSGGIIWAERNNNLVQNTVFHTDETSTSAESSNQARAQSLKDGWRDIRRQPFGEGPGTAGPASVRNDRPPRIAENYYLQLGQEVGVIGLGLFVVINLLVAVRLYVRRSSALALGLLAGLAGLTLVNMLSHAWADDTLGMLWWGLAGIALAQTNSQPVILNKKQKRSDVQTKEKPA